MRHWKRHSEVGLVCSKIRLWLSHHTAPFLYNQPPSRQTSYHETPKPNFGAAKSHTLEPAGVSVSEVILARLSLLKQENFLGFFTGKTWHSATLDWKVMVSGLWSPL